MSLPAGEMGEAGKTGEVPLAQPPSGVPPANGPVPPPALVSIEEFHRFQFRVGRILSAQEHPKADRLLVLMVDLGEASPRQLVAGIRGSYDAASLIGKHVVVVANLKPAMLRGIESQGMVLAASDSGAVVLISPERPVASGSQVK